MLAMKCEGVQCMAVAHSHSEGADGQEQAAHKGQAKASLHSGEPVAECGLGKRIKGTQSGTRTPCSVVD